MLILLAIFCGVMQAASLAFPLQGLANAPVLALTQGQTVWWLQLAALGGLVGLLRATASPAQAALAAWLFATAWLAATFSWLYVSMHIYGGLSAPLAGGAVLALAGALALYYAAAGWAYKTLLSQHPVASALVFAALWLMAEMARGQWLTGFGWGAIGYAHLDGPLAPLIAWVGVYGVTWVAALVSGLIALAPGAARQSQQVSWAAAATALLLPLTLGSSDAPEHTQGELSVTLLQGNIAQEEKFEPASGIPAALHWYAQQLNISPSALTITPETALPVLPNQLPQGYLAALQTRFLTGEQAALVGTPMGSFVDGYSNSVMGLQPGQAAPWRYDKHHLVPFGEFIPPFFRWFTELMSIPLGDFTPGGLPQPTFDWQGQRLAVTICFENLFSEELAAHFVHPLRAPTILVNVSNLGWFGEHLAMDQHLQIARMRALEFGRPFLLATNTGRSAIVNHLGVVTHSAPAHTAAALHGVVQGRTGLSPYASWMSRFGTWPLWATALAVVLAALLLHRQPGKRPKPNP